MQDFQKHLKRVREDARVNDMAVRAKSAKKLNERVQKEKPIREGDIVYIKKMPRKGKFDTRLKGPFKVIKQRSNVTFDLESVHGHKRVFTWHRVHMRGHIVHQRDAESENFEWLKDIQEEVSASEQADAQSESAVAGGECARVEPNRGCETVPEDVWEDCSESVQNEPQNKNTNRGDGEQEETAQSAPADPSQSPCVENDSAANAPASELVTPPRRRGRPRKSGDAPLAGADRASEAPRTQPAGEATLADAAPTLPSAEAVRDESLGSSLGESAADAAGDGDRPLPRPESPGSGYNLRSSKRVAGEEP